MTSHDCHTRHTSDTLPVFIFFRGKRTFDSVFHMKLDLISSEPVLFYSFDFYIDVNKNQKNKTKNQFCWNVFFWKKKKFFFPSLDLSLKKESKEYLNPDSCACITIFVVIFYQRLQLLSYYTSTKNIIKSKKSPNFYIFSPQAFFNCSYAQPVFFRFAKLQHESSNKRVLIAAVRDVPFAILWKGHWTISLTHAHTL